MNNFRFNFCLVCLVFGFAVLGASDYEMAGGVHILADFTECDVPDDALELEMILREAAKAAGSQDLDFVAHQFEPQGISAVLILAESHISIHSWPEKRCAAVDVYTCGKAEPQKAIDYLKVAFKAGKVKCITVDRGNDLQEELENNLDK